MWPFKKKDEEKEVLGFSVEQTAVLEASIQNTYPEIVKKIHREFYTASDRAVEEALAIINENRNINLGKINRLKVLGFNQVSEVLSTEKEINDLNKAKTVTNIISDYRFRYPNNKFIKYEDVIKICEKYDLIIGQISRFRGFVPEKNLTQVESFKLKDEDKIPIFPFCLFNKGSRTYHYPSDFPDVNWSNLYGKGSLSNTFDPKKGLNDISRVIASYSDGYYTTREVFGHISGINEERLSICKYASYPINAEGFMICAPQKDMDTSDMKIQNRMLVNEKEPLDDPIVLKAVKGGYLIVTAWGNEASDPLVVNEINN